MDRERKYPTHEKENVVANVLSRHPFLPTDQLQSTAEMEEIKVAHQDGELAKQLLPIARKGAHDEV